MKAHQVKELTEYTKQLTEELNKKFPDLNISDQQTRELINTFQFNLRSTIIKLNQQPPTGIANAWDGNEFKKVSYHIGLIAQIPAPNRRNEQNKILLTLTQSQSNQRQSFRYLLQ